MGAVSSTAVGDLRRRRLQTVVLALVLALACAAATLALSVLATSQQPFERAFAATNGAHLVITYQNVPPADLAATTTAEPVTATAGPWPVARAAIRHPNGGWIEGQTISGRPRPDATIDAAPISEGRWWERPGEAVIGRETADALLLRVGDVVAIAPALVSSSGPNGGEAPGGPAVAATPAPRAGEGDQAGVPAKNPPEGAADRDATAVLTIVGIAQSVSTPDTALWMHPDDLAAASPDVAPAQQMLYRVDPSANEADLAAATTAITADLDASGVTDVSTYLSTRTDVNDTADLYVPILLAFSVFALAAAAFTIANVVSGTVLTRTRDIGVMKAVGFAPGQVTTILVAQVLVPVAIGAAIGTAVGAVASLPTSDRLTRSFGLPGSTDMSVLVLLAVPTIAIGVSLVASLGPAIAAGRLDPVAAITRGTMPARRSGGGRLRRLAMRLPVGLPARLGIASGSARPLRSLMTLGALVVGVAALTFAIGVDLTLLRVVPQLDRNVASPVRAMATDPTVDPDATTATIAAMPDTGRSVALGRADVTAGTLGETSFVGYDGDASWIGFELIRGRWIEGPGEVVAPTPVFTATGLHIGDTLAITGPNGTLEVRLVGETFEGGGGESPTNTILRGTWSDVVAVDHDARIDAWEIRPRDGVAPRNYVTSLVVATDGALGAFTFDDTSSDEEFLLFLSVVASMGIVLVAISLGGVFNTVLLETRQRTREMAVLKAVGLAPAQVVVMVTAAVVPLGLLAGLLGVPIGLALQRAVISYMGQVAGQTGIPDSAYDVFGPVLLVALALAGLAIAVVGAYLPAQRAASARIAPVLAAE